MKNISAAIEFGTSKIICVIGRQKSNGSFEVLGSGMAPYEGIKKKNWINPAGVPAALMRAVEKAEKTIQGSVEKCKRGRSRLLLRSGVFFRLHNK